MCWHSSHKKNSTQHTELRRADGRGSSMCMCMYCLGHAVVIYTSKCVSWDMLCRNISWHITE